VTGVAGPAEGSPHCHVPAEFDPEHSASLGAAVGRFVKAAQWLARELEEGRGCHAALLQVAVLQSDLDAIAARLVDGHLRFCVNRAVAEGQTPEEVHAMLVPVQSLLFARRSAP
jgi:DNA-binding FrmR family transcriptional regulator